MSAWSHSKPPGDGSATLTDAAGTGHTPAHGPARIVSLVPSITEFLYALDLDACQRWQAEAQERCAETASHAGEEGGPFEAQEPEVDLMALSDKSHKLLNTAILFYGFFGLWLLWSDLFPALRILDQITLWHHTVTVDGEAP